MEKIKVGEYIRTELGQITKIDEDLKEFIDEHRSISEKDRIEFLGKIKHSPNIIDLIEVGDYVNGDRMDVVERDENGKVYYLTNLEVPCVKEKEIKSIVTKEQFSNIEYRLEDYPMNEEDIKILEQYIKSSFRLTLPENVLQAIENLINRNKYLEKKNDNNFNKIIEYERTLENLQKNTIWKYKIK